MEHKHHTCKCHSFGGFWGSGRRRVRGIVGLVALVSLVSGGGGGGGGGCLPANC